MFVLSRILHPVLALACLLLAGCSHAPCQEDAIYQNAPIQALLAGCYSGTTPIQDLEKRGDFGIGTLDALDGEMVVLDHDFYQIKPDGKAYRLNGKETSPFATLTFFKVWKEFSAGSKMDYPELTAYLDRKLPSENLIYAIRIEGKFPLLKVRSAARQDKPYPVLTDRKSVV